MASIIYKLSKRGERRQILVWLKVSASVQVQLKSGVYIDPKYFDVEKQMGGYDVGRLHQPNKRKLMTPDVVELIEANRKLDELTTKLVRVVEVTKIKDLTTDYLRGVGDVIDEIELNDISFDNIKKLLYHNNREGFTYYADLYPKEKELEGRELQNYRTLMRYIMRWEGYRQAHEGQFCINIDMLSADDIINLRDYIRSEHILQVEEPELYAKLKEIHPAESGTKHKVKDVKQKGDNTIIKLLIRFKTFWLWLINTKGATTNNPFKQINLGAPVYGTPYYLTIEERNKIADFDLSHDSRLSFCRDVFVFQCMIGCRVSDLYSLTKSNIHNNVLEYVPIKTKDYKAQVKPRIPLTKKAQELIKQYEGKDPLGRLFPFTSQQKYNDAIKDVMNACGITRSVPVRDSLTGNTVMRPISEVASSHMARRTFVGNAYNKVKDPNIIGKMSGHVEGSRAFARYREINDDVLKEVIDLIE